MSQQKRSVDKTKRKSSLPIDFKNLNFDILNPDHLSKIQGPDYDSNTNVGDSFCLWEVWDVDDRDSSWKSHSENVSATNILKLPLSKSDQYNSVNNMTVPNSMNVLSIRLINNPDKFNWVNVVLEPKLKSKYYFIIENGFLFSLFYSFIYSSIKS